MEEVALKIPKILLPKDIDMTKWAVVACDQYTSQPDYWEKTAEFVGDSMSTLHIILPEIYLESEDKEERIKKIREKMKEYSETLEEFKGFILVDRTARGKQRKGLVVALDLEQYDFSKDSNSMIRPTEGTIVERIPPRIAIREGATLESPHIMVLIDDPEKTVVEPLFKEELEKAYDFELMNESGHIKGYKVGDQALIDQVAEALKKLECADATPLYAMGDGNHSFATAKAAWEDLKKQGAEKDHPARYALVELVNVHDTGLEFEPIHRVVFDADPEHLLKEMKEYFSDQDMELSQEAGEGQNIEFLHADARGFINIKKPKLNLEVGSLQAFLDKYIQKAGRVDYVHGKDVVEELGKKQGNIGFLLPHMDKHDLFKTVALDGALPRKTFSMGEADEKRFYLECRKIVKL